MQKVKKIFGNKKRLIVLVIIVIIGILLLTRNNTQSQPQYETAQVTRGTIVSSLSESGQVTVANRVSVTTQASGVINQVYVQNGDTVTAGQKIADITLDRSGQQNQAQAWSSYLSAQNSLVAAQVNVNTLQAALFKANQTFITDRGVNNPSAAQQQDPVYIQENATWLAAEATYKNQTAVITQAQASLASSWLSYLEVSSVITAPTVGVITDLVITPGMQLVNATSSSTNGITPQTIGTVRTDGNPVIAASISEIDVVGAKTGNKATVTFDAFPNKTFTGIIIGINTNGTVSSGVATYPTTILLDTPNDSILPNMSASINIITDVKHNVLLVPSSAIQTANEELLVRVLQNGSVVEKPVTIGNSSDTETEIVSGLKEGDTIVTGVTSASQQQATGTTTSPFSRNIFGGGGGRGGR